MATLRSERHLSVAGSREEINYYNLLANVIGSALKEILSLVLVLTLVSVFHP